jgi:ferritin-like metal-binding protein YciE
MLPFIDPLDMRPLCPHLSWREPAVADTDKNLKTTQDWCSDMLALETHIEEALDRQLGEIKDDPKAAALVQEFHNMVKSQRDALKTHLESIGGKPTGGIKAAGTAVLGMAAGVIDKLRTEGQSKSLRDDYTAFNLAAIGYSMLYTTGVALGQSSTATIAERHLRGYARAVQQINHVIASSVVSELQKDGHTITNANAEQQTREMTDRIWKETAQSSMTSSMPSGATSTAMTDMPS